MLVSARVRVIVGAPRTRLAKLGDWMARNRLRSVAQDLANKIVEAFERYRDLFFKPFGEGSMRWALQPGVA